MAVSSEDWRGAGGRCARVRDGGQGAREVKSGRGKVHAN